MRPVVYVGPNCPARGLQRFTVFSRVPQALAADPVAARVFVSVDRLAKVRADQRVQGSPAWSAYRAALAAFNPKVR